MTLLNLAATIPVTAAEGPGQRFAVWVQGCPMRCAGCCNPQYLEFKPAREVSPEVLVREIMSVGDQVEGITLVGGEPFSQAAALAVVAASCREAGLSVMTFTGYTHTELADVPESELLLAQTDLLVAGPYVAAQHSRSRRWIGSENQTIHFLTERYASLRDSWPQGGNTIELRLNASGLSINGFPHRDITRLSRRSP